MIPAERTCLYSQDMVCPYCGHAQSDSWEFDRDDGEAECGDCDRTFRYSRYVEITFSTTPIIGPHKLCEYGQKYDAEENPIPETDADDQEEAI